MQLLEGVQAPIVLADRFDGSRIATGVAPGLQRLGVMLPYSPLHLLFMQGVARLRIDAVVATSGNVSGEPICIDDDEAPEWLADIADTFLTHNRGIARPVDDSVVQLLPGQRWPQSRKPPQPMVLRRGRGYAPAPVVTGLFARRPRVVGLGGQLNASVAHVSDGTATVSQYLGDLHQMATLRRLHTTAAELPALLGAESEVYAHDQHPDYESTHLAARLGASAHLEAVQHHHAHVAACLAEHGMTGPALDVAWDGTGYGPDGTVWGGELLVADLVGYRRLGSLRPLPLPGAEQAVHEPRRVALAVWRKLAGDAEWERLPPDLAGMFSATEARVLGRMLASGVASPWTSSAAAESGVDAAAARLLPPATGWRADWRPMMARLVDLSGIPEQRGLVVLAFHRALAATIQRWCRRARGAGLGGRVVALGILGATLLPDNWQWVVWWVPFYWIYDVLEGVFTRTIGWGTFVWKTALTVGLSALFVLLARKKIVAGLS